MTTDTSAKALFCSMATVLIVGALAIEMTYTIPKMQETADRIEKAVERLDIERQKDASQISMFEGARRTQERQEAELLKLQFQNLKLAKELKNALEALKGMN